MARAALVSVLIALMALVALAVSAAEPRSRAAPKRPGPPPARFVIDTPHNLSARGPGAVRAVDEDEVCIFCHASHQASAETPLWNLRGGGEVRVERSTGGPTGGEEIDGASVLCMTCHEGSVALGSVRNRNEPIRFQGVDRLERPTQSGPLHGSGAHPVSRVMEARPRPQQNGTWLKDPSSARVQARLDPEGEVQCTSCHDPHADIWYDAGVVPRFWLDPTVTETCERCHDAPMRHAGHSTIMLPGGCASCHQSHGVRGTPLLPEQGEAFCYRCHGESKPDGAQLDLNVLSQRANPVGVAADFAKPHRHPVQLFDAQTQHPAQQFVKTPTGAGWSTLDPLGSQRQEAGHVALVSSLQRSVECVDCHPIHGQQTGLSEVTIFVPGAKERTGGRAESKLCFECHGDTPGSLAALEGVESAFGPTAVSSHPIERLRASGRTPGLTALWSGNAVLGCGSCHGSDDPDGPSGPHGSLYDGLLVLPYREADAERAGLEPFALCFSCHDQDVLNDSGRGWPGHRLHVAVEQEPCYACHDPHGSVDFVGLLTFRPDGRGPIVGPDTRGQLRYEPDDDMGTCQLACHGVEHPTGPPRPGPRLSPWQGR